MLKWFEILWYCLFQRLRLIDRGVTYDVRNMTLIEAVQTANRIAFGNDAPSSPTGWGDVEL